MRFFRLLPILLLATSATMYAVDITCEVTITDSKRSAVVKMPMTNLKPDQTYPLNAQDGLDDDLQIKYHEINGQPFMVIEKSRGAHGPHLSAQGSLAGEIILTEVGSDGTVSQVSCRLPR
jgi:hypothetical protein